MNNSALAGSPARTNQVILVVGDWFVDEHWVCEVHRSASSSRTGRLHRRVLHNLNAVVQAFCGAGRSAAFLHQLYSTDRGPKGTSIVGVGFWHRGDTKALGSLFASDAPTQNLFRLTSPEPKPAHGIDLINMNDAFNWDLEPEKRDLKEYTTRIIRMYGHNDLGQLVYDRLDWEPKRITPNWTETQLKKLKNNLDRVLQQKGKLAAILIKDLRKGAINDKIVEKLVQWYGPSARWYVSSKCWYPDWLKYFNRDDVKLELLVVPQIAAQEALQKPNVQINQPAQRSEVPLGRWLTRRGELARETLVIIDDLVSKSGASNVVILPEGFSVVAYGQVDRSYVVQSEIKPPAATVDMGMASIAFPAMVAYMEHTNKKAKKDSSLQDMICWSLRVTQEWILGEYNRVKAPTHWSPKPIEWSNNLHFMMMRQVLQEARTLPPASEFGKVQRFWADQEMKKWKQAFDGLGIVRVSPSDVNRKCGDSPTAAIPSRVSSKTRRQFQLWRSMVEIPGYVCIDDRKRSELRRLRLGIENFPKNSKHHASCMIVASPGSGKSFLVKCIASVLGFRIVPFNITQLRSKADLVNCFDTIVAIQKDEDRPLLVFMDEINAPLEGGPPYSSFLTALEDGSYVRDGKTFSIYPCIWVFAGTTTPGEKKFVDSKMMYGPDKGSDFFSRLTFGTIDLKRNAQLETDESSAGYAVQQGDDKAKRAHHMRALENVYIGVAHLKSEFREVRYVSEQVLEAFYALPIVIGVRDIKHFVRCFREIQYGRVTSRNVPREAWPGGENAPGRADWEKKLETEQVSEKADIEIVD